MELLRLSRRSHPSALVPELAQLVTNEVGLFLKNPVSAFLDDAPLRALRKRPSAVEAVRAEGAASPPAHSGDRKLRFCKFGQLRRLLVNKGVMVETGPQISRLLHLHDIALQLLFADRIWIVG